jgi:hypothetical protein
MGGRIDHTITNLKSATVCVLRVGAVGPGDTPLSNTAINREEDEPSQINKQIRRAKLNLAVDLTIKLRSFDEPQMEDLLAVSYSPRLDGCKFLHNCMLSIPCTFLKGVQESPLSCWVQRRSTEVHELACHTTSSTRASTVGSVVGSGVGTYDVFHWERMLKHQLLQQLMGQSRQQRGDSQSWPWS